MSQQQKRTISPVNCKYVSIPSNANNQIAFRRSSHTKLKSPSKETNNNQNQIEDVNIQRVKEVGVEVAKFLNQINKSETNNNSLYSSIIAPDKDESILDVNRKLQQQVELEQKNCLLKQQQIETWKQKYAQVVQEMNELRAKCDSEIKALSKEIQIVNERITTCELQQTAGQTVENFTNLSIQTFQRTESGNEQLLDEISEKNKQIQQLNIYIEKLQIQNNEEVLQQVNEMESLRNQISQFQVDHQRDLEIQKNKMQQYQDTLITNMKRSHVNQIDILKEEIKKLKELFEIKNEEINTLVQQNQKLKYQVDFENQSLRQQIGNNKQQLLMLEQQHQEDLFQYKNTIENMNKKEIENLTFKFQQQLTAQDAEIKHLKDFLSANDSEQQKLILEKLQQREFYQLECMRLNKLIDEQKQLLYSQRNKTENVEELSNQKMQQIQNQYQLLIEEKERQFSLLRDENSSLKTLINKKENQINEYDQIYNRFSEYEENLQKLEEENIQIHNHYSIVENEKIQELESLLMSQQQSFENKLKKLEYDLQVLDKENTRVKQLLNLKNEECFQLNLQIQRESLRQSNYSLQNKVNQSDNFNNQIRKMSNQISDLQSELMKKNQELTEMIDIYQQLEINRSVEINDLMKKQIRRSSQILQ